MRMVRLSTYHKNNYCTGEISIGSLRKEIREDQLPGGVVKPNGTYWVDLDVHDMAQHKSSNALESSEHFSDLDEDIKELIRM